MNRTRCPHCHRPVRFDPSIDRLEDALYLHELSGLCNTRQKPPPLTAEVKIVNGKPRYVVTEDHDGDN